MILVWLPENAMKIIDLAWSIQTNTKTYPLGYQRIENWSGQEQAVRSFFQRSNAGWQYRFNRLLDFYHKPLLQEAVDLHGRRHQSWKPTCNKTFLNALRQRIHHLWRTSSLASVATTGRPCGTRSSSRNPDYNRAELLG